eukprot:CAMPEP_0198322354 /NCGR_PEP_ID=MMETSP1450-20131203/10857_1 /TAXON_ID=753684 ORGANISM="Madagascaria erythrocladiodes, Strain CCMP3234" /NCGR_SAMPLE_ID=MMETSP1450 /ASSEMBLY_ACC=CAM_ASM_001115 /LENGTH=180 /DNA_ID=CAMNT_0044025965 /DNA_START=362 /DNA_END=904 /DNA_ORIENTATION=+
MSIGSLLTSPESADFHERDSESPLSPVSSFEPVCRLPVSHAEMTLLTSAIGDTPDPVASRVPDRPRRKRTWARTWSAEEDHILMEQVALHGARSWSAVAKKIPGRNGKQARERWLNQLNPKITKAEWGADEDRVILKAHKEVGNRWSLIAKWLPGRTDNDVKNRYNSTLRHRRGAAMEVE